MKNLRSKILATLLIIASFTVGGCIFDGKDEIVQPLPKDPVVIVVADSSVPIKVTPEYIIPWDCYFVVNTDLLSLMDGDWVEFKKQMKKMDICDVEGYILHPNLVDKKGGKIKLKE